MDRRHLKSVEGDALHAVLCAEGYNIRWLQGMIVKKGLGLLLCLLQATSLTALMMKFAQVFSQQWLKRQTSVGRWTEHQFCMACK